MNEIEVVSLSVVHAAALAETPQFKAFEQAYEAFSNDVAAHQSLSAYQDKAKSLRAVLMLNAVSETERAELERLKMSM